MPYLHVGRLGYYTHYQEPEFGLLQLGVRFYEPEVGRFEKRDPVGKSYRNAQALLLVIRDLVERGQTAHSYAVNAPTARFDPEGMTSPSSDDFVRYARDYLRGPSIAISCKIGRTERCNLLDWIDCEIGCNFLYGPRCHCIICFWLFGRRINICYGG